jgi:hypothetical protein
MPEYTSHNAHGVDISICEACFRDLDVACRGARPNFAGREILEGVVRELRTEMIAACAAALAEHRLAEQGARPE